MEENRENYREKVRGRMEQYVSQRHTPKNGILLTKDKCTRLSEICGYINQTARRDDEIEGN